MHYYQFHIGDFRAGTVNMSRKARWIYRDMIDVYYDTEKPLPSDLDVLCDMLGVDDIEERMIVERHLRFKFELNEGAYRHPVCDSMIAEYHAKACTARTNGKKGGRPPKNNLVGTQNNPVGFENNPAGLKNNQQESGLKANHKPLTINQEPEDKSSCDQQAESPKADRIDYQSVAAAFGEHLPALPQPRDITDKRKKAIRSIVKRGGRYAEPDFFAKFFGYVAKSDFLMARGAKPWHGCSFDWLLKPENFQKIIEGNYHGEGNNA
jgi:uncharacterized protein YdaU (DUF1376 family)